LQEALGAARSAARGGTPDEIADAVAYFITAGLSRWMAG